IETRLSGLGSSDTGFATWGLFLFVFLMVFREGVETVLFLAAVSLRPAELLNFFGGVIGLGLACSLGIWFFKGRRQVKPRTVFRCYDVGAVDRGAPATGFRCARAF